MHSLSLLQPVLLCALCTACSDKPPCACSDSWPAIARVHNTCLGEPKCLGSPCADGCWLCDGMPGVVPRRRNTRKAWLRLSKQFLTPHQWCRYHGDAPPEGSGHATLTSLQAAAAEAEGHVPYAAGAATAAAAGTAAEGELSDEDLALLVRYVNPSYLAEAAWDQIHAKFFEEGSIQLQASKHAASAAPSLRGSRAPPPESTAPIKRVLWRVLRARVRVLYAPFLFALLSRIS